MKKILFVSLVILVLALSACGKESAPADESDVVACTSPEIPSGTGCCMDADYDGVCDDEDEIEEDTTPPLPPPAQDGSDQQQEPEEEIPELYEADDSIFDEVKSVEGYLNIFQYRDTVIIFDQDRTTGPIVTATMDILGLFAFPDNIKSTPVTADVSYTEYKDNNMILLGNGCNNNLIKEMFGNDHCREGMVEGKVMVKLRKLSETRKYIVAVIGEDEDVYKAVKAMVNGDVPYSGNDIVVNV